MIYGISEYAKRDFCVDGDIVVESHDSERICLSRIYESNGKTLITTISASTRYNRDGATAEPFIKIMKNDIGGMSYTNRVYSIPAPVSEVKTSEVIAIVVQF